MVFAGAFWLLGLAPSTAQTVITQPGGVLVWDQETAATDTVKPTAYTFDLIRDAEPAAAITATCTAPASGTTYVCRAPLPDLPNGTYTFKVVAKATVDGKPFISSQSDPLSLVYQTITFIIQIPKNLRIEPGSGGQ
jgi:hypothetical protein